MCYSKWIIWLCFLFVSATSNAQFPAHPDSVYTFMKYNSILRNNVNWDSTDRVFREQIKKAASLEDTIQCFVTVLEILHDYHSQIYLNNKYYGTWPSYDDSTLAWLQPLRQRSTDATNKLFTTRLNGSVAYMRLPGAQVYGQDQINAFAKTMQDSICSFSGNMQGLILDLRLNGGGNIYPMLSGLRSLLGDGIVAYETGNEGNIVRTWLLKEGNFTIGGYTATTLPRGSCPNLNNIPVVVLTGPVTVSSGSMVAIAFKHRANTIFIGEPTADGYTTSNGFFQFAPNLTMNFATNYVADRNKNVYRNTVDPDIYIHHGDNFDALMDDAKIKAALLWLKQNGHH